MSNSQIPYTFVPGTKAMASEINANFLALANIVDEGKQFTTDSISEFATTVENRLDEAIGNVLQTNMSNSVNLTNCLTDVTQKIKYTFANGIFTLKAGSKLIVPNGYETDGVTLKFNEIILDTDVTLSNCWNTTSGQNIFYNSSGTLSSMPASMVFSGSTAPTASQYMIWYDTSSNLVKQTSDGGSSWVSGGAFILGTCSGTTTKINSIECIYNGLGIFKNIVWIDKGIKGLIPNGLNSNGTFNNIEYVSNGIVLLDLTSWASLSSSFSGKIARIRRNNGNYEYMFQPNERFITEFTTPSNIAYCYIEDENRWYIWDIADTNPYWNYSEILVYADITLGNGSVNLVSLKRPISLVTKDYLGDFIRRTLQYSGKGLATYNYGGNNNYIVFANGLKVQWGTLTSSVGTITFPQAFNSNKYFATCTNIVTSGYNSGVRNLIKTRTTTNMTVAMGWSTSSSSEYWLNGSTWLAVGY